ncbi:unnamed protein product [Adineta steineri]|uniref:Tetratricopeptide repeat protein n=1 Tax=Adineta steineri TaxID=433720 RepID=A0A814AP63_9BILA|nr:unnamed protein product [Adineta steineri]
MGFFLKDLHQQIVELHSAQSKTRDGDKFTVYRGQGMAPEELEKIKDSEGGLLSFNNFLSTTYNEEIAKDFAKKIHTNSKVVAIIFQMEINPKKSSVPFAFIDKESTYKYESENLFSMHTVFRIMGTRKLADRFWQVNLALTSDNDPQLKLLSDYMRKELGEGNSLSKLGHLMLKMGEFDQAHDIYGSQLDSTDKQNWRRHSYLNHQLGWVFSQKGEYKAALSYYEKALNGELNFVQPDDPLLAPTYHNIAGVHQSLGDYTAALASYQKALAIEEKSLPCDDPLLATTYTSIGLVHRKLAKYDKALSLYQKALAIRQKTLPPNHPDCGSMFSNISGLHQDMGDYSKALEFSQKALDVYKKSLPPKKASKSSYKLWQFWICSQFHG